MRSNENSTAPCNLFSASIKGSLPENTASWQGSFQLGSGLGIHGRVSVAANPELSLGNVFDQLTIRFDKMGLDIRMRVAYQAAFQFKFSKIHQGRVHG